MSFAPNPVSYWPQKNFEECVLLQLEKPEWSEELS